MGFEKLYRHCGIAPVDDHLMTCDEVPGFFGSQKQCGTHEFLLVAETVHGCVTHDGFDAVRGEDFAVLLGRKEAGY